MSNHSPILVLGGGVCGLYAALTIARSGREVIVLECEPELGGLAGSAQFAGNPHDFGVHMLHGHDTSLLADLQQLVGEHFRPVSLDARIRWRGQEFHYPLRFLDLLKGLPMSALLRCFCGLAGAGIRQRLGRFALPLNAEEALQQLYGVALYELFFKDFTERYWGRPASGLSATFVAQKMPRLSAVDAVREVLRLVGIRLAEPGVDSALAAETLHYSARGAAAIPEAMGREITRLGGHIHTDVALEGLEIIRPGLGKVQFSSALQTRRVESIAAVISTIPLPELMHRLVLKPPPKILKAAAALRYRPMVVYGVLVKRERCMEGLYTYFREACFHRVSEPKSAGAIIQPPGHTLLLVERMCERGDSVWCAEPEAIDATVGALVSEGLFESEDVIQVNIQAKAYAYPVFTVGYEGPLEQVQRWLKEIAHIDSVGRQGGFSYVNMHQAMREGEQAALRTLRTDKNGYIQ